MKSLALVSLLLLTACASGPKFSGLRSRSKTNAVLYVYRPAVFSGAMRSPDIVVNSEKIGSVPNGSYFVVEVPPGSAKILQRNFAGEETGEMSVVLKPKQIYFLRMDLGIPTWKKRVRSDGQSTDQACPFQGLNLAFSPGDEELTRVLGSMDSRVQSDTCCPGFMFVTEDLAQRELAGTKLSK